MKKIYLSFLVASFFCGNILLLVFKESFIGVLGFSISIFLSYSLYENLKLWSGIFGSLLSICYILLYYKLKLFAQFNYEIYSFFMFFSLIFRKNLQQKSFNLIIELIFSIILGFIIFVKFYDINTNLWVVTIDISAYFLILIATIFTSRQMILQFYFYIPASILIAILSCLVKNYAILFTNLCFVIADGMSLVNWRNKKS